ncbi:MAG: helix-turn-helix domain-containing protein [Candidatus Andersenbacteria bacterium]|nr:helix-turn-helix domain-containing protein [Candidatus Andersenbacteria bacterium]
MSHVIKRRQALQLRKKGKSYSQIKASLGLSKSTLSAWLHSYPLSSDRIHELQHGEARIEKYRQTMRSKREVKFQQLYVEESKRWLPLSNRELLLAGLFLYWGEGGKTQLGTVSINNTDPQVLQFALFWMVKNLEVPKRDIHVFLHLYSDMNIQREITYWSKVLGMPKRYFDKPYIKQSKRSDIDQKGHGHGTCGLRIYKTEVKQKILVAIKVLADHYSQQIIEL